ncbi:MAG: hypothetical protein U0234_20675 [Sandaracinus sp.]
MRWTPMLASIAIMLSARGAAAQERPAATILTTQLTGVEPGEGAAFDRTLRARLDALQVVRTEGAVALDLEQIQLALGCMGETTECLSAVAAETGTPIIVVPSLAAAGSTVVATVLVYDGRDQTMRRGTREVTASDTAALLGGVEGLLREVFGLPPVAEHEADEPPTTPAASHSLSIAPPIVIGIGALALLAGAIVGGLSLADASTFQSTRFSTQAEVDAGLDGLLARQRAEAFAADGLLIGGAVVAVAGLVWMLVAGNDDGSSPLALAPIAGPSEVGLALAGTFGGAL